MCVSSAGVDRQGGEVISLEGRPMEALAKRMLLLNTETWTFHLEIIGYLNVQVKIYLYNGKSS